MVRIKNERFHLNPVPSDLEYPPRISCGIFALLSILINNNMKSALYRYISCMGIEDPILKKIEGEKGWHKKAIWFVIAVVIVFVYGLILSYYSVFASKKAEADYSSGKNIIFDCLNWIWAKFGGLLSVHMEVNLVYLLLLLLAIFLVGKNFSQVSVWFGEYAKEYFLKGKVVFEDNFISDKGWYRAYWEENNPKREEICRLENSKMVFEATSDDVVNERKKFGAYFDVRNLVEGNAYSLSCEVCSVVNTTMKFQLWLHNDVLFKGSTWSMREPPAEFIPNIRWTKLEAVFSATATKALRIHMEATPGIGKIFVRRVKLIKLK